MFLVGPRWLWTGPRWFGCCQAKLLAGDQKCQYFKPAKWPAGKTQWPT